jgi:hypothetical protein
VSNEVEKEKKKKGGKIVLAICIILIIVLCVIIYLLLSRKEDDETKRKVLVNEDNVEEILSDIEERTPSGSYEVTMNSTWYFESGTESSDNAYVENAETNENSVYFDVTRSDTEETILESPIIPVGEHMNNITLDSELSAGTYDCVMTYHLLDDDEETISTVRVGLTIVIQN